jgi:hypothetical protein
MGNSKSIGKSMEVSLELLGTSYSKVTNDSIFTCFTMENSKSIGKPMKVSLELLGTSYSKVTNDSIYRHLVGKLMSLTIVGMGLNVLHRFMTIPKVDN